MTDEPYAVLPAACEPIRPRLSTQQIGRLGELLVQYELLRNGIDSAPMTTDAGIDLLAYSGVKARSFTIQVKTNLTPKPGGGKGAPAIDWWVNEDCPAEFYAFVDLFNSPGMASNQTGTRDFCPTAIRRTATYLYVHKRRVRISRLLTAW
jgi:hypothetical protein